MLQAFPLYGIGTITYNLDRQPTSQQSISDCLPCNAEHFSGGRQSGGGSRKSFNGDLLSALSHSVEKILSMSCISYVEAH